MAKPKAKPVKRFVPHKAQKLPLPEPSLVRGLLEYPSQWPQEAPGSTQPVNPTLPQGQVVIVEPDPLDEKLGLLYVLAAQRILAFAQQYPQEVNPETFVRNVLARVVGQDPTVKVLVALDAVSGEMVGHILAMIEGSARDRWVFCYQAEAKPGILQQFIDAATPWGKAQGAKRLLMATFIDPEFWRQRYNFETVRHVMSREI